MSQKFEILYFKTPTCNWCPYIESILKKIVKENDMLALKVIDVTQDEEMADKYNIIAIPTIILPNMQKIIGAADEKFIREKLSFFLQL